MMAKVTGRSVSPSWIKLSNAHPFAASEGSTLAGAARTDDPPAVPMSGGAEPAGAAKHSLVNRETR